MEYYINNSGRCNQTVQFSMYDRMRLQRGTPKVVILQEQLNSLRDYISRNMGKAIYIGEKVNATSSVIPQHFYNVLAKEFPHLTVRWYDRPKVQRRCSCGREF